MSRLEATLQDRLEGYDVLVLPGWKNSGPAHWQSHWEDRFPEWQRVQQHNWVHPDRDEWVATLDRYLALATRPVVLLAHSLGCVTVAHWAALARQPEKVAAAFLVAPADVERSTVATSLRRFAPIPRQPFPFPSLLVGSDNDPACQAWRACELAQGWGSRFHLLAGVGHINADSGLGDWDAGLGLLSEWLQGVLPTEHRERGVIRWAA